METKEKIKLNEQSDDFLIRYLRIAEKKANKLEAEILEIKKGTERLKIKNDVLQEQLDVLKAKNAKMLKQIGWEGITDDEFKWVLDNHQNYKFDLKSVPLKTVRRMIAGEQFVIYPRK